MDPRSRLLLQTLIERYIADGQPVGSRTLSRASGLELSAATIRNVMADLEDAGLIASPHTSAGRVPTPRGYRMFVDAMLTARAQGHGNDLLQHALRQHIDTAPPQQVMARAAQLMSSLSQFVGVVLAPKRTGVFRHIEFLRLSERRIVVIIVSPEGDVQNRMLDWPHAVTQSELNTATNYLNAHFSGKSLEDVAQSLGGEVENLRVEIVALMQAGVRAGSEGLGDAQDQVLISGQQQLLGVDALAGNLDKLRQLFDLFEQKAQLLKLMDASAKADGVRIYIGGESEAVPFEELSVITAPFAEDDKVVGTLGVIGPTRMAYDRMIQIVDITAKLVSNALSQR